MTAPKIYFEPYLRVGNGGSTSYSGWPLQFDVKSAGCFVLMIG